MNHRNTTTGPADTPLGEGPPPPLDQDFDPDVVPRDLRDPDRWVCWKWVPIPEKPGEYTKVPVVAGQSYGADTTNPNHLSAFAPALSAARGSGGTLGIGSVFVDGGGIVGVDVDGCIGPGGVWAPKALEIVASLPTYWEISPSGTGVKGFLRGVKPAGAGCTSRALASLGIKKIEVYERGRFFTVTGRHVPGTPLAVNECQAGLDDLCRLPGLLKPAPIPAMACDSARLTAAFDGSDDALIEKACAAKNGDRFRRLLEGDRSMHGGDDSSADLAFCNLLAFWTGKDRERMDRIFRGSGLFRPKWDSPRGQTTYGGITLERAIAECADVYSPHPREQRPHPAQTNGHMPPTDGAPALPVEPPPALDGSIPLGQRDPDSGRLVLSPRRTLPTAEAYLREFQMHTQGRTLHAYGGVLLEWAENKFRPIEEGAMKQRLLPWLHRALRYGYNKKTRELELMDFEGNPTTVAQALESVRSIAHLPASTVSPSWLCDPDGLPPATELVPCRTMNYHIPTDRVLAPTPALFNVNALDFDYDPDPDPPERWIKFLEQLFGEDLESVELLQEWMGYTLTGDTSQQKMLLIIGPRRSGKGTIGRIMGRLVGVGNVAGPTTGSLAGNFGLQPLIDKSLAIVSDARFSGEGVSTVVERLLCISGEDTLSVDRKFLGAVSMKLPTRFVFLSNELPKLLDSSAALAGRFLVLRLEQSFYGREDPSLTDHLVAELPGILKWAIAGWRRLKARGHFVQPASSADAIHELEDLASPVGAFLRECCEVAPGHRIEVDALYAAWCAWCQREGRDHATIKTTFGRDLAAAAPGVKRRRGTGQIAFYEGLQLAAPSL